MRSLCAVLAWCELLWRACCSMDMGLPCELWWTSTLFIIVHCTSTLFDIVHCTILRTDSDGIHYSILCCELRGTLYCSLLLAENY